MVDQCRRAVAWVYRNAASFGGNANELYLCSRSSGRPSLRLRADYRMGEARAAARHHQGRRAEQLDVRSQAGAAVEAWQLRQVQPTRWNRHSRPSATSTRSITPLVLAYGTLETPEFQRKTRDFAAALKARASRSNSSSARATITPKWGRRSAIPIASWGEPRSRLMKLKHCLAYLRAVNTAITGGQRANKKINRSATRSRGACYGGAAAGTLGLATDQAAAQRCAGPPPPHVKGPRVWLDLDQKELDEAYEPERLRVQPAQHQRAA